MTHRGKYISYDTVAVLCVLKEHKMNAQGGGIAPPFLRMFIFLMYDVYKFGVREPMLNYDVP